MNCENLYSAKTLVPEILRRSRERANSAKNQRYVSGEVNKVYLSKKNYIAQLKAEVTSIEEDCEAFEEKIKSCQSAQNALLCGNISRLEMGKKKLDGKLAELLEERERMSNEQCAELNRIANLFTSTFRANIQEEDGDISDDEADTQLKEIMEQISVVVRKLQHIEHDGCEIDDTSSVFQFNVVPDSRLANLRLATDQLHDTCRFVDEIVKENEELTKIISEKSAQLQMMENELAATQLEPV